MLAALASLLVLLPAVTPLPMDAIAPAPGTPGAAQIPAGPGAPTPPHAAEPAPAPRVGEPELAPIFAPGAGAEGKAAYDAGRHAEAVARLARAPEPEARYVRALALSELDRWSEALRALEGLEGQVPALADRIAFLRGEALAGASRGEAAAEAWAEVPDGSLLAPQARLGRARLAAARGDRAGALAVLAPLVAAAAPTDPSRPDPVATALLLEVRLRSTGPSPDLAAARRDALTCWVGHPLAPEAPECLAALRGLAAPFGVPPGPDEVLQRAESLIEQNRNPAARALLEPLAAAVKGADADAPLACRIRAALGRVERRERNIARSIELLGPVVQACTEPAVRVRALYVLAGATAISGDRAGAVALYRQLAREYPEHPYADDALLYAAQLLARDGRAPEARASLSELLDAHPAGDQAAEARFLRAWLARDAGELDDAVAQLSAIERQAGADPYERARAGYWRARIQDGRGDAGREEAQRAWTELATLFPTDYYGLLSRARLLERGTPLPRPRPALAQVPPASYDPGPLRDDPHLRAGILLYRMGFPHAAAEELEAVPLARVRPGEPLDPVLLVADVLDRAGDHRAAHGLLRVRARDAFRRAPDQENLRAWLIAYPPAYRDEVERAAAAAGVPPALLQALMREESALDPRVISPAGAVGLTQLMLPTAQGVAHRLKLARPARADLMQPALNLRLGAQYLGELLRRYDGEVALALAGYNAGGGAVARWREAMPSAPLDEWVERLPVEETRGYVKRVLRSYAAYAALYGGGQGDAGALLRLARE